jgi:lysyl-tRNA synthetase class 1
VIKNKKEPFIVASAITTSGPSHIGTVCEFLYPSALVKYLQDSGYAADFLFIGDIMDAFDSIPKSIKQHLFLKKHFGQPLCDVPDPYGCCISYGDHFLCDVIDLMSRLEVSCQILKANDLVSLGKYDNYARIFYDNLSKVKKIAERITDISGSKSLPDWVDIVMPVCENCGKIATTKVTLFDGSNIQYSDTKDVGYVKGCGYTGEMKIKDHRYKLFWRLDWPSRQDFLNVSAELAGVDHHTKGGSWDTAVAVHREIFKKEPPISKRYGFVFLRGKKYSKSKGIGLNINELLQFVPPPLIKYRLFRPDIGENKDFDPSGNSLIRLYNDFNEAAELFQTKKKLSRGKYKKVLAYRLSTDKRYWKVDFTDILLNYQIYNDWKKVAEKISDKEGIIYLKNYVENWIEKEFLPEEYVFQFNPTKLQEYNNEIVAFSNRLDLIMNSGEIHNLVYDVAKEKQVKVRDFFKVLYLTLISKDHGPRFGRLVTAIGVDIVKETLENFYISE